MINLRMVRLWRRIWWVSSISHSVIKKNTSGQVVSCLKLLWLFLKLFWFLFKVDWIFPFACMCSNGPTILWRIERNYCFQSLSWMGVAGIDLAERALACVGLSIKYESVYRQHWVTWELFIPAQFIWSLNLLLSFSIFRVLNKRNRLQVDFEESQ